MNLLKIVLISLCLSFQLAFAQDVTSEILNYYSCPQDTYLCKALSENLDRDSNRCRVEPRSIAALNSYWQNNSNSNYIMIQDRIRYFGPVTGPYHYQLRKSPRGQITLVAKMYFKNLNQYTESEIKNYIAKFQKAAELWNYYSPYYGNINFQFELLRKWDQKSVQAQLIRQNTRGPYYSRWSLNWDYNTIAHEFGHVMGLFDEYDYMNTNSSTCNSSSLMCSSHYGHPQHYHYHLILQRPFCKI